MRAWKTVRSKPLLRTRWLSVHRDQVLLPNGRLEPDYLRVEAPSFSSVVPLTRDGRIILLRHYKHGAGRVIHGLPAGHLERGERPLAAAKRELKEETGYVAKAWTSLGSFIANANRGGGTGHYFLAKGAVLKAEPALDDLEECEVVLMRPKDALKLIDEPGQLSLSGAAALMLAARKM